jgi:hypothetical protein
VQRRRRTGAGGERRPAQGCGSYGGDGRGSSAATAGAVKAGRGSAAGAHAKSRGAAALGRRQRELRGGAATGAGGATAGAAAAVHGSRSRRKGGDGRRSGGRRFRTRGDVAAPPRPAVDRPSQVGSVASAGAVGFEPDWLNQIRNQQKLDLINQKLIEMPTNREKSPKNSSKSKNL